jgi:hypothetical protein
MPECLPHGFLGKAIGKSNMTAPAETVRLLADRIRQLESSFRLCKPASIPLGSGLGDLFPQEGLAAGSLVELLPCVRGAGAWTFALLLASYACGERKTLLIADHEHCFYPPAAQKFGLDVMSRIVVVRPRNTRDALHALGQALRCLAIGAAIGAFERLQDRDVRRLQLAAEYGGGIGVLLRPVSALGTPSFASVRLRMHPERADRNVLAARQEPRPPGSWNVCPTGSAGASPSRHVRLEVLRCQGGREGKSLCVEIDDATGHVRAFSPLELAADLASSARPAG